MLIIPTEVFSARRVRWMFRREFSGTAVRIEVPSFDPSRDYTRAEWWKTEAGVIAFQNEVFQISLLSLEVLNKCSIYSWTHLPA